MALNQLPEVPESAYQLGELRKDFSASRAELALCVAVVIFLVGSIGWAGFAGFLNGRPPQNAADWVVLVGTVVGMVAAAAWGGWHLRKLHRNRHMRVLVFDDGFVSFRSEEVFVCRWDEIAWVADEVVPQNHAFIIYGAVAKRSGEEWRVRNDVDRVNVRRLLTIINNESKKRLVPRLLADLEAGQTLDFGALKLSPQGVVHGERVLPWAELKSIGTDDFWVTVKQRGAWKSWAAGGNGSVPNRFALIEVAGQFKKKAIEMTLLA
jgi:Family of unknown function (DUF6585)